MFFAFTVGLGTTLYVLEVRVYIIAPEKANKQYRQCGNSDNILKVPLLQYNNITLLYELKKLKLVRGTKRQESRISSKYLDITLILFIYSLTYLRKKKYRKIPKISPGA